jgi:hypothetical protein
VSFAGHVTKPEVKLVKEEIIHYLTVANLWMNSLDSATRLKKMTPLLFPVPLHSIYIDFRRLR